MTRTALNVTPGEMAIYRATAQRRAEAHQAALAARKARARQVAQRAATLLKTQFGAKQVLLFGSLAHDQWFTHQSDIDLAVTGLAPGMVWRAWREVEEICDDFEMNLVEMETVSGLLRQRITEHGCEL